MPEYSEWSRTVASADLCLVCASLASVPDAGGIMSMAAWFFGFLTSEETIRVNENQKVHFYLWQNAHTLSKCAVSLQIT
jgi:hypothetical protein